MWFDGHLKNFVNLSFGLLLLIEKQEQIFCLIYIALQSINVGHSKDVFEKWNESTRFLLCRPGNKFFLVFLFDLIVMALICFADQNIFHFYWCRFYFIIIFVSPLFFYMTLILISLFFVFTKLVQFFLNLKNW